MPSPSDGRAILATSKWATNADLIADCATLGYLRDDWRTLDCTYGVGTFWKKWRPQNLVASDIFHSKSESLVADFTRLPFRDRSFDAVVFDPPYKLNGTPDAAIDNRYGVDQPTRWQDRMGLIRVGLYEAARVLGDGYLLVKCQDQVCSGKVRWQTTSLIDAGRQISLGLVDRFDLLSYRPQPEGRRQVHARRNTSTLLVFQRGYSS